VQFGHLENIETVDFSLPPEPENNKKVLGGNPKPNAKLYIGSTHWIDKDFVGNLYPAKAKANQYLYYYSQVFTTLELNATHYRIFEPKVVERWAMQTSNSFVFCPKMYQVLSHRFRLKNGLALSQEVAKSLEPLGQKLGPVFIQLPENMSAESLPQIEKYFKETSHLLPLALEIRHASFLHNDFFSMLHIYGISTCITDVAGRRELAHMHLSTPQVQIRFVGNGGQASDFTRIEMWLQRLQYWFNMGLEKAFFFIHQPNSMAVKPVYDFMREKALEKGLNI